jgi:hypothetical protein
VSRRDKPAGPAQRRITVLTARIVPLPAEEERQAVHALASLLAAHLDRRAETDPAAEQRRAPADGCQRRSPLTSRQRRGVLPTTPAGGYRCPGHADDASPEARRGTDDTNIEDRPR